MDGPNNAPFSMISNSEHLIPLVGNDFLQGEFFYMANKYFTKA